MSALPVPCRSTHNLNPTSCQPIHHGIPKLLPDFTACTRLKQAGLSTLLFIYLFFKHVVLWEKLKICTVSLISCLVGLHMIPTAWPSTPAFPLRRTLNQISASNYFYETYRKLIFWETFSHWSDLTDGCTDTTQPQWLHKLYIPKETS